MTRRRTVAVSLIAVLALADAGAGAYLWQLWQQRASPARDTTGAPKPAHAPPPRVAAAP